jgi:hypothetical protein
VSLSGEFLVYFFLSRGLTLFGHADTLSEFLHQSGHDDNLCTIYLHWSHFSIYWSYVWLFSFRFISMLFVN